MMKKYKLPSGVYPVITSEFCLGRNPVDVLRDSIMGGAEIVQLREKKMSKKELYYLALEFRRITAENNVTLIINDYIDIALAVRADGVHLGQEDLPCRAARQLSEKLIIGISTHNTEEIKQACLDGASYINIGPVFRTATKANRVLPLGTAFLREVRIMMPFSVMGGIKRSNIHEVLNSGARTLAMVTEITEAPDVYARVREIQDIIKNA